MNVLTADQHDNVSHTVIDGGGRGLMALQLILYLLLYSRLKPNKPYTVLLMAEAVSPVKMDLVTDSAPEIQIIEIKI